ncbi:MAG TPA: hypothetical protein VK892_20295 [Pyrinomonadaceae bacterium]|nr:hypothetical protein [Pyrinomonadaceae bacterium]
MAEVQRHGFDFENWVKETFFSRFTVPYNYKWDVPPAANILPIVPKEFLALPVSIKTSKNPSSIAFGDALRQFRNKEDFLLIAGFWEQAGEYKNFVVIEPVKIKAKNWRNFFTPLTESDLILLDSAIKNPEYHYTEARLKAKEIKKSLAKAKIILNPKIDSKGQRRLQCSVPYKVFWEEIAGKEPYKNPNCSLFGIKVPNPFLSGQRVFKPKFD